MPRRWRRAPGGGGRPGCGPGRTWDAYPSGRGKARARRLRAETAPGSSAGERWSRCAAGARSPARSPYRRARADGPAASLRSARGRESPGCGGRTPSAPGRSPTRAARRIARRWPLHCRRAHPASGSGIPSPPVPRSSPSPVSSDLPHARVELDERRDDQLRRLAVDLPLLVHQVRHLQPPAHRWGEIGVHGKLGLGLPAVHVGDAGRAAGRLQARLAGADRPAGGGPDVGLQAHYASRRAEGEGERGVLLAARVLEQVAGVALIARGDGAVERRQDAVEPEQRHRWREGAIGGARYDGPRPRGTERGLLGGALPRPEAELCRDVLQQATDRTARRNEDPADAPRWPLRAVTAERHLVRAA